MGTGLVLRPNWPQGQATKTASMRMRNCLLRCGYFCLYVSGRVWVRLEEGNEAGFECVPQVAATAQSHTDLNKVGRVFPMPLTPSSFFLLCCSGIRADIKFLSTSSRWRLPLPVSAPRGAAAKSLSLPQTCYTSVSLLFHQISVSLPSLGLIPVPLPLRFTTVYAKWQFLLSSPACGWPKQINKSMRTHINSQTVCARPACT